MKNDALQIYRGKDFVINDKIVIHQPTLDEICDWGEDKYFSFVYNFTATPTDKKYLLHKGGYDWNETTDYELFISTYKQYSLELSGLIFGELSFQEFEICTNTENSELVLYNPNTSVVFDRSIYEVSVDYLRKAHNIKKNVERAMTETTKEVLLEEAKEIFEANKDKEFESILLPLISTVINMKEFKHGWLDIWDMKINAFMDSVKQVQHVNHAELLLSSGYSGFGVDLKKIDKNSINYFYKPNES